MAHTVGRPQDKVVFRQEQRADRVVVIVDVAESVRLVDQDEVGFVSRWLDFLRHVKKEILPPHGGRFIKSLGDGMLLDFNDVRSAVLAAFAMQEASHLKNVGQPPERQILLRAGVESGEVIINRKDVYGRGVNRAARLFTLAGPGEIIVSANVRDQLTADLDADIEDLGNCYLKHMVEPVRAYRIGPPGTPPVMPPGSAFADLLPSLAVVPFATRDLDDHHVLGEVIAEELIRDLSQSTELHVISRLSTTVFRGREASLAQITANLRVTYVLSGKYTVTGGRVTIDVELAEARSEQIVWTRRYKGQIRSILPGRREVIDQIAADVSARVMSRELQHAQANALPNLPGYTLLIGAIALMHRLSSTDFEQSRKMLEALIERAPRQPIPQAWLAKWHVLRVQQGWSDDPEEDARFALRCTKQALGADPNCSLALGVDGFVHTNLLKRLDVAQERYERALLSNPNDAHAWLLRGTLHAFMDEGEKAVSCTRRALRLSPLDPHRYFYDSLAASACIAARKYASALDFAKRSLRANRNHTSTLRVMAVAQWHLGLEQEARRTAQELMKLEPGLTVSLWLERAPSAPFRVGQEFARVLRLVGVPN
jgi:class 3 adenylate cyclase/TolB-like protein/tetratricopeptide (TPR) repeat protein